MPYITASDHPAAADRGHPAAGAAQKEGQAGQAKITQYTRYLTLGLARPAVLGVRGAGPVGPAVPGPLRPVPDHPDDTGLASWLTLITLVITMTAGTGVVMWLGELITDRGVGNGMSVLIFTSIAARLPAEG